MPLFSQSPNGTERSSRSKMRAVIAFLSRVLGRDEASETFSIGSSCLRHVGKYFRNALHEVMRLRRIILSSIHFPCNFKLFTSAGCCSRTAQLGHHHLLKHSSRRPSPLLGSYYAVFMGISERCARCICDTILYYGNRWCWDRWASLMHHPRCLLYERKETIWSEYAASLSMMGRLSRAARGKCRTVLTPWEGHLL